MRIAYLNLLLIGMLTGCAHEADHVSELTSLAHSFLVATAAGDSMRAGALAANSGAVVRAMTAHRVEPDLLRAAAAGLSVTTSRAKNGEATIYFRFPDHGKHEAIEVGFAREGDLWKVTHITFPSRQ
jgi:hypothetical protein